MAGVPQEFAAVSPQTAGLVAGMLSGTYEGPGAMPPTSFAIYFATAPAAALATTWGMPETEVSLVQGFLMYLALGAVEPTYRAKYINDDMQAGLLVARTPRELIEGFVDPMLGDFSGWDNPTSRVEHAIAYTATFETIEAAVGMPLSEASHETGPKVRHRVLYRGVDDDKWTGRMRATRGDTHVAMPRGTVKVDGLWSGNTNFGTHIEVGQRFHVWSEELGGRVIVWEAVGEEEVEGLQTMRLELAEETFRACGEGEGDAGPGHPACLTPDTVRGAWDQADVYKAPAVRTLPDFARSDLAASGARSAAPSKAGTWFINVDVNTGYPVRGSTAFQLSHRLSRTERFYPTLYQSPEGTGVWVPTHAINVHYTVGDKSFSDLRGLRALLDMTEAIAIALIVVGVLLAVPAALLTAFLPSMRERRRLLAECTRSTAPPSALYGEEEAKSARVPTARRGYKGTRVDELRKEVSSGRSGAGGSVAPESTLGASSTEMGE